MQKDANRNQEKQDRNRKAAHSLEKQRNSQLFGSAAMQLYFSKIICWFS
jgi:hypothetical protein